MLLRSEWIPHIKPGNRPTFERLAEALSDDIIAGRISAGSRLPASRKLAHELGTSLATVSKAYTLLQRQGLLAAQTGSGTFVSSALSSAAGSIDMSRSVPPNVLAEGMLRKTLLAVGDSITEESFSGVYEGKGDVLYLQLAINWLSQIAFEPNPDSLFLMSGADPALNLVLTLLYRKKRKSGS